jgi:acyl-CoA thioester hydrolase
MTALAYAFDELNPKFVHYADIHFDELDPMQMLHNSRFVYHVERAIIAFYGSRGHTWQLDPAANPDQFHVVRELRIEYLSPFLGTGRMRIEVWVDKLGTTSCVYGFLCTSEDGRTPYARGQRTIIKIDPQSKRPSPWTQTFLTGHSELTKDFRALP